MFDFIGDFLLNLVNDPLSFVATVLSVVGAHYVASYAEHERFRGYLVWVVSNIIWVVVGIATMQPYLMILFGYYFLTSLRGLRNNHDSAAPPKKYTL